MQLRVFNADNLPNALGAVRRELGPHAFILKQNPVRSRPGWKGARGIQVMAATLDQGETMDELLALGLLDAPEPEAPSLPAPAPVAAPTPTMARPAAILPREPVAALSARVRAPFWRWGRAAYDPAQSGPEDGGMADPAPAKAESPRPRQAMASDLPEPRPAIPALRSDLISLRAELENVRRQLASQETAKGAETPAAGPAAAAATATASEDADLAGRPRLTLLDKVVERLRLMGLEPEYARALARDWFDPEEASRPGARVEVDRALEAGIGRLCQADADLSRRRVGAPRVIAFVGATGVGKTTTIAKIAAREVLQSGRRVGLITCDTYRIAAIEQLRMYARIIGIPIRVVQSAEEMRGAIAVFGEFDLILIDTPGLSPQLVESRNNLNTVLAAYPDIEKFLVLSSTTKTEEMLEVWKNAMGMRIDRLVITKIDESIRFGCLLPVLRESATPVAFLTNGQRVPEDLAAATPQNIRQLFDNRVGNDGIESNI